MANDDQPDLAAALGADDAPEAPAALRHFLESYASEFVVAVSARGELIGSSHRVSLGWDPEEQGGRHIAETLHPDDLPRVFDLLERARGDASFAEQIHVQARHKDGSWRVLSATVLAASHPPIDFEGAVVRVRDLTDELSGTAAAIPSDNRYSTPPEAGSPARPDSITGATGLGDGRFASLAEAVPMGILSADARGWVVFVNNAATVLFDLPEDGMLGSGWMRAVEPDDLDELATACSEVIEHNEPREVTFRLCTGLYQRWVHARFVPLGQSLSTGWMATVDDITERRRAESHLAHLATHDTLTGLPNRHLLEDRLRQASGRLRRGSDSLTVVFVDLDEFKEVNDTLGHAVGDAVLVETAARLRSVVRDVDTTARLGGDEFVVVCEALDPREAEEVAGRIESALARPFHAEGHTVVIGASAGVVTTSDSDADVADLLGRADQAMYRVKHRHRSGGADPTIDPEDPT